MSLNVKIEHKIKFYDCSYQYSLFNICKIEDFINYNRCKYDLEQLIRLLKMDVINDEGGYVNQIEKSKYKSEQNVKLL